MKPIYEYSNYEELLNDLKKKYGAPKDSYFINGVAYNPRKSIKRSKEGLFIHHDREDTVIMLSSAEQNKKHNYPFAWHNPENLTYCNFLEHLMLHILIATRKDGVLNMELKQETGSGGITTFMAPQINTYISGAYLYKMEWLVTALSIFDDPKNVESYFLCLEYFVENYNGIIYPNKEALIKALSLPDRMVSIDSKVYSIYEEKIYKRLNN